jgi:AcrR family transcriptional regulator
VARPKTYDAALRQRLIDAAAAALATGGADAVVLRPIAAAAGTSTSAVYTLFGDRDGLIAAAIEAARHGFTRAQAAAPLSDDPIADLMALGHAYRDWALANPALYQVMFARSGAPLRGDPLPPVTHAPAQAAIGPLRAVVTRLVMQGRFRPDDPDSIVMSIWAGVHGFVALELSVLPPVSPAPDPRSGPGVAAPAELAAARQRADRRYAAQLAALDRGWRAATAP